MKYKYLLEYETGFGGKYGRSFETKKERDEYIRRYLRNTKYTIADIPVASFRPVGNKAGGQW